MAVVRERLPGAVLLLLDYEPAPAYRRLVVETIDRLRLHEAVRWTAPTGYDRMSDLYCLSDVTVSVAGSDGVSQSVLESMAASKPVVLGDLPNYRGLFENGRQCRMVDAHDPSAIAAGILDTFRDAESTAGMVREARATVERLADLSRVARRVEAQLQATVSGPSRPIRLLPRLRHALNLAFLAFESEDKR
jgi:glycosyltransferase involved in cell wall biosynthesis